jgi:peptidoglycan/LPS O-acetylase OafA/YrhL
MAGIGRRRAAGRPDAAVIMARRRIMHSAMTRRTAEPQGRRQVASPPARRVHNAAIDLLKGYAILGVLWQHAVPASITNPLGGNLWARPAVPIFFILLGLNLGTSLTRRGLPTLDRATLSDYARRRLARVAVPFLVVLAVGYVIAAAQGTLRAAPSLLIGGMPVNAPGNYFLTALIAFIIAMPFLVWAYARRPVATLVACIALDVAFEAIVYLANRRGITALGPANYPYQGNPLRWLAPVALGLWASTDPRLTAPRNRWLLLLAIPSALYLILLQTDPARFPFVPAGFLGMTNVLAAPWAFLIVLTGLRVLPTDVPRNPIGRGLAAAGRASYHIYLVQMLWMGVVAVHLWAGFGTTARAAVAPVDFAACLTLGWLYFRVLPGSRPQWPWGRNPR